MSACQERMGTRIKLEEKIVIFMAEYAAYLINRLEVGKDGKTAYERCRGKQATVLAIEFGEKLLWKVRQKNRLEKLNPRWEYGVFVGVKATSGEVWAATKESLQTEVGEKNLFGRAVERDQQGFRQACAVDGEDPEADGDLPEALEGATATGAVAAGSMDPPRVIVVNTKEVAPREFYIKKKDVEAYGHIKGCPGCRTMFQGGTRQAHTTECRERFRDLMKDEDKVVKTLEKRKEYEEKMEEETRRMEMKKRMATEWRKKAPNGGRMRWRRRPEERGGKAEDEGLQEHEEAGGDGMTVEAVLQNDVAWDDVKDGWLDGEKVREARMEEVGYMKRKLLWDEVSRSDASGHRIVSVKWVDTNKGTENKPEIRCRLVARDFRGADKDREDLFAATPPWELKKLLMSHAADRSNGKTRKMLLIDVKKAHLNSECTEDVFIELPEEVGAAQGKVGKLRRWLYGFRPAAAWEAHYANKLEEVCFRRGLETPVSFYQRRMTSIWWCMATTSRSLVTMQV